MNYVKAKLNWEEVFIQEAIDLEEKMSTLDLSALNKSRLRLSLEKDILSWKKYRLWITEEINCASLQDKIETVDLNKLLQKAQSTYANFASYNFWNEDLIPIDVWEDNLIVIGLEKNEKLIQIPKAIFILASPQILSSFAAKVFSHDASEDLLAEGTQSGAEESSTDAMALLDGIDINMAAPILQFNSASLLSPVSATPETKPNPTDAKQHNEVSEYNSENSMMAEVSPAATASMSMWDYLSERHEEYCFEARKQFDAYMVLKIVSGRTQVFKMDADLQNQNLNTQLFAYGLTDENPFKKVLDSGSSESFNINQLGFTIRDFKYACITPLKRGHDTVGFLVGLKTKNLAETDQTLLEDLAKESA
ncbi:MAG: hypothetical protein H7256_05240 [Bdellovibrio sp.]|nr:hypothetical protein [Bdellovibrio sp.]